MAIDPVVMLICELRAAEEALAVARGEARDEGARRERLASLEDGIAELRGRLFHTVPAGPIGACELIRIAAGFLEPSHAPYAGQLRRIAARLGAGRRVPSDILWLRQMTNAVTDGLCGDQADAQCLLQLAMKGATAPLVVYRAVETPPKTVNGPVWDDINPPL